MSKWKNLEVAQLLSGLVRESTIKLYSAAWNDYRLFCKQREPFNATTLIDWRQHLIDVGYSANTINRLLYSILSIARELMRRHEIERVAYYDLREVRAIPLRAMPERNRPHTRTRITPEQMRALCAAPVLNPLNPLGLRDRALMLTLATSGLRVGECCRIKFIDIVQLEDGNYVIRNVHGKYDDRGRTVPLSGEAYEAIMDWMEFRPVSSPYVFTAADYTATGDILYQERPLPRQTAAWRIKKYADELGIEHVKPHDFRRFVGTQLAKTNLRQAQKVLGHSSVVTTTKYYVLDEVEAGITNNLF